MATTLRTAGSSIAACMNGTHGVKSGSYRPGSADALADSRRCWRAQSVRPIVSGGLSDSARRASSWEIPSVVSSEVRECCMGMVIQDMHVDLDAVCGIKRGLEFVVAVEQLRLECAHHLHQLGFKLCHVYQRTFLFREVEDFQLAVHALRQHALAHQIKAVFALMTGGLRAQLAQVRDAHFVKRGVLPIEFDLFEELADFRLRQVQMVSNLLLSGGHL